MYVTCLDMEGVLVPEIWIAFAEASGIPELKRTTRDEPDYDKLMNWRLGILRERTDHASDARDQEHAAQHFTAPLQVGKTRKEQREERCRCKEHRLCVADLDRRGRKFVLHGYERRGEHRSIELECEDSHQQRCHYRDN